MDLRHFYTFKKILETGSFTKAANAMGYTQSSVTAHMKCLETDLGIKIFDRIGRNMVLTQAGHTLVEFVDRLMLVMEQIDAMENDLSQIKGTIRVSAPATLVLHRLCYILKTFAAKAPNVNIVLSNYHSSSMVKNMLTCGESDVAIVMEDTGDGGGCFVVQELEKTPLCIIAGRGLDIDAINIDGEKEPLGCGVVLNQSDSHFRREFEAYLKERKITPSNSVEVWGVESIKRCVSYNMGISILPFAVIGDDLIRGSLQIVECKKQFSNISICMVTLKNKWESPAITLFKETVTECFKAKSWP